MSQFAEPFNVRLMDVDQIVQKYQLGQVKSHNTFEATSTSFHPEGLFSEVIFGEIMDDNARFSRFGYIDLKTRVMHPHVFATVSTLKTFYESILAGRTYAIFDEESADFIPVSRGTLNANTGFEFFVSHLQSIDFTRTDSIKRDKKIKIFETYTEHELFISKLLVIPAGIRDFVVDQTGAKSNEAINTLYRGALALSQAFPDVIDSELINIYDGLRYSLQKKVNAVYAYLTDMFTGKKGFAQRRHASRATVWGARNVISAAKLTANTPNDPDYLKHDESLASVFQTMSMFAPMIVHNLKSTFIEPWMTIGSTKVPLIDPKTYKLTYVELTERELARWQTDEGIMQMIADFGAPYIRSEPVTFVGANGNNYYLMLVYDDDKSIYLLRNIEDFKAQLIAQNTQSNITSENIAKIAHLDELREILDPNEFIIMGSGALVAHGLVDTNNDLDLIVTEAAKEKLLAAGNPNFEFTANFFLDKGTNLSFDEMIGRYVTKDGIKFLALPELYYAYKAMSPTDKTKARMELIQKELDTKQFIDVTKIRPLTYIEMFYIVCMLTIRGKHTTVTRDPVIEAGSTYPSKIAVSTTTPSRVVEFKSQYREGDALILPRYPIIGNSYVDSFTVHPLHLKGLGGDHDGDTVKSNGIMTREANKECAKHLRSPYAEVDANKRFISTAADSLAELLYFNLTRIPA